MPVRYSKLGGNTVKFPYLVGITTGPGCFGTGILISTRFVLTCGHVLNGNASAEVVSKRGQTSACVRKVDDSLDLALLELAEPISASKAQFTDSPLQPGVVLLAAGVQATPGEPDHLSVAEVELKYRNKNDADGKILDLQFEGGARPGYSGGPVVAEERGSLVCVGIIRCGGNWAASSNAIGLGSIRAFVAESLPAASLQQPEPAKRTGRSGILLRRALIAAVSLCGVVIGASAGWKYLAPHSQTITSGTATVSPGNAANRRPSSIEEQRLPPPESSDGRFHPKSKPSLPTDASPGTLSETFSAQTPEEVFVSKYIVPGIDNAVRSQRRWAIVISADRDGFPNLVPAISAQISSSGATTVAVFRPSITSTDGFQQLFAGDPALNKRLGQYCDRIFVGKVTSALTKNAEYGILTLSLSLQAKLMSVRLGTVDAQFMISESGAGLTTEEAATNAEERLALKLKDRLATVIER